MHARAHQDHERSALRTLRRLAAASLAAAVTAACSGSGGSTAPAAEFFADETIQFVVPYEPGGGYDVYARMIAPRLAACASGEVIVVNEPGAGGLLATSKTAIAEPDGTRIQIINTVGTASSQIGGSEGVNFDLSALSWLGRVSAEPNVLVVAANSPITSFADIVAAQQPVRFVATGPGSNEYINSTVLPEVYGFPSEIITGFAGSGEARAAVLRGDADAHILPLDSQLAAIRAGEVRPLLVIGPGPSPQLPGVQTVHDVPPSGPEGQPLLDALIALVESGRSVAAPPDLPADRLTFLRDAIGCALSDPALVEEAASQQRPISYLDGPGTADLVNRVLASDPAFQELVRQAS
jgi:tripartite-type tricarboxylate transporter receptor subunit TctC